MRLIQSIGSKQTMHGARDKSRTLCGYPIGRSWQDWGAKWMTPPYERVSCKHCRRVLGPVLPQERARALGRAVTQLGEVVGLAIEAATFKHGVGA